VTTITTISKPLGKRRWRRVRAGEIKQIRENLCARGTWYGGCVGYELVAIYGAENLKHVAGQGWYKLTSEGDEAMKYPLTTELTPDTLLRDRKP